MQFGPGENRPPQPASGHRYNWSNIEKLGVCPEVRDLDTYLVRTLTGGQLARSYLRDVHGTLNSSDFSFQSIKVEHDKITALQKLQPADITATHDLFFKDVHPWAGTVRRPFDVATFNGLVGADSIRIETELELTCAQIKILIDEAWAPIYAIAVCHLRLARIHPFQDGNGRVIREITAAQIECVYDKPLTWSNRERYFDALRGASAGIVSPLCNYLLEEIGEQSVPERVTSPFRLAPFLAGDARALLPFDEQLRSTIL